MSDNTALIQDLFGSIAQEGWSTKFNDALADDLVWVATGSSPVADRSWHALDSVLPQEEANSEANQEKSGDVVSHTEKILRSNDRHNQWG
jgi:hypothetical protein